jgi:hypothetical protein
VRRSRKSGSDNRKATDLVAELYGHVKVTTALIDLVEGAESTGVSCAIGMCIVVSNVVARPLVTSAMATIFLSSCRNVHHIPDDWMVAGAVQRSMYRRKCLLDDGCTVRAVEFRCEVSSNDARERMRAGPAKSGEESAVMTGRNLDWKSSPSPTLQHTPGSPHP